MSRPRKQGISGLLSVFNLALGLFRKKCNVLLRILMSLDRKEKAIKYTRCKFLWHKNSFSCTNYFPLIILSSLFRRHFAKKLQFFRSYFYSFFLYLPFHQINEFCCEFIWNTSVGKIKQQQQTNQQNKTKAANSVYFSSITSRITLLLSIYLCFSYI